MAKITVVGSLNSDLSICTTQLPKMGETLSGSDFQLLPGGKGLNQATAAALLGSDVHLVGGIGADAFGTNLLAFLVQQGIQTQGVKVHPTHPTGCAMITIYESDNSIIIFDGANGAVTPEWVENQATTIATSQALIVQLEIPLPAIMRAMQIAKHHQVPIIFNPAPICELPAEFLAMVDIIIVNEHECEQLTGVKVTTAEDAEAALNWFENQGVTKGIITLGSRGVYFSEQGKVQFLPAQKVVAIDTTGAGDTFIGALTTAYTQGQTLAEAVQFAIRASAITVTRRGAASAMPTRSEVETGQ